MSATSKTFANTICLADKAEEASLYTPSKPRRPLPNPFDVLDDDDATVDGDCDGGGDLLELRRLQQQELELKRELGLLG